MLRMSSTARERCLFQPVHGKISLHAPMDSAYHTQDSVMDSQIVETSLMNLSAVVETVRTMNGSVEMDVA